MEHLEGKRKISQKSQEICSPIFEKNMDYVKRLTAYVECYVTRARFYRQSHFGQDIQ